MMYTLPSLMDDLTVQASYSPGGAGGPSASAIGFTYAGVEGLSVSYGAGQTETIGSEADATTIKGSYAYGSFTFGLSQTDYDVDSGNDDEVESYKISYTVTDDLSITYCSETHSTGGSTTDEEVEAVSASFTSGGMTISAAASEATGVDHATGQAGEAERWKISASFAF